MSESRKKQQNRIWEEHQELCDSLIKIMKEYLNKGPLFDDKGYPNPDKTDYLSIIMEKIIRVQCLRKEIVKRTHERLGEDCTPVFY